MRTLLFVSSLVTAALALAPEARACTCLKFVPPDGITEGTEAVFEGTVVAIEMASEWERLVTFEVLQSWDGVEAPSMQVVTGLGGGDCGYEFVEGETYLVFAHASGAGGPPSVSICSATQESSAEQLAALGQPIWSAETDEQAPPDESADGAAEVTDSDTATDDEAIEQDVESIDGTDGTAAAPHAPSAPKPPSSGAGKKGGGCSVAAGAAAQGGWLLPFGFGALLLARRRRRLG